MERAQKKRGYYPD